MSGIIRILADRSKDSSGAAQFANLLPYAEFQSTDNRRPLRRSVLGKYDVLAICGQSLKKYTRPQLAMIREFVEAGGGLVLAASAPVFELEANRPIDRMAQNAVAGLFGAAFLSLVQRPDTLLWLSRPLAAGPEGWREAALGWGTLILLAVGPTIGGYGLYTVSLTCLPAATANLITTLEPALTAVLAYVFLGERLTVPQLLGGSLILIGVVIVRFSERAVSVADGTPQLS